MGFFLWVKDTNKFYTDSTIGHVPLAFLTVPPFLLFCEFFHPPLQTVSVHDVDPDLEAHLDEHITSLRRSLYSTSLCLCLLFLFIQVIIVLYYEHTSNLFGLF